MDNMRAYADRRPGRRNMDTRYDSDEMILRCLSHSLYPLSGQLSAQLRYTRMTDSTKANEGVEPALFYGFCFHHIFSCSTVLPVIKSPGPFALDRHLALAKLGPPGIGR